MPETRSWSIPRVGEEPLQLTVNSGQMTVIVGPNGAGKSSLISSIHSQAEGWAIRTLHAHRLVTMESSASRFTAAEASNHATWVANQDRDAQSRYQDNYATSRPNLTLHRLTTAQNYRSNLIADAFDSGTTPNLTTMGQAPLRTIAEIMDSSGLHLSPSIDTDGLLELKHNGSDIRVPLQEASDGERAALLLAADILTAPQGCITIIDEPEIHFHGDLAPRLLSAALQKRPDQHFIISTHDISLAAALPNATILVVENAHWRGKSVTGWTVEKLEPGSDIPEEARKGILGGRTRILFVEGNETSHDPRLYSALFPDWTVKPAGSCETVIRIVTGTAAASGLHWLDTRGIIDNDARSARECNSLALRGVFVLPVCELESLLYLKPVLDHVTSAKALELDEGYSPMRSAVDDAISRTLSDEGAGEKLALDLAKKVIYRKADDALRAAIAEAPTSLTEAFKVNIDSDYPKLLESYRQLIHECKFEEIIQKFPVRNIGMRSEIAKCLRYPHYSDFEKAAVAAIARDRNLRSCVAVAAGLDPLLKALADDVPSAEQGASSTN